MKYTSEIIIAKPINEVTEIFNDPENLNQWQRGLISFTPLEGTPGQPGATSKLLFDMNGRKIEMIETIIVNNLPSEFSGSYDAKGVYSITRNFFNAVDASNTRLTCENEFQFSGFMKLIGLLFPGTFRKTSQQYLQDFKAFAEHGTSVAKP